MVDEIRPLHALSGKVDFARSRDITAVGQPARGNPNHDVRPEHPATVLLLHDDVVARTTQFTAAIAFIE